MSTDTAIPSLMFMTIGIVVVIVLGFFVWHMRKRSNRKPMEAVRERTRPEMEAGEPHQPE